MLIAFLVYSSVGIFMKLSSMEDFLSTPFILYCGLAVCVIAIYAVLWQVILKQFPLAIAFMSKSITIVFTLLIAHFVFAETITTNNIIGSLIIIFGIISLGRNL